MTLKMECKYLKSQKFRQLELRLVSMVFFVQYNLIRPQLEHSVNTSHLNFLSNLGKN